MQPAVGRSQCGFVNGSISAGRNWPAPCAIACFAGTRDARAEDLEDLWSAGDAFACLSVRTGFDLWLQALQLPPGSEVLVSAITIRDMVRIIEAHDLVPVPVDLNPEDLSVDIDSLQRAITPENPRDSGRPFVRHTAADETDSGNRAKHGLFVAEDCAQAFAGRHFTGASVVPMLRCSASARSKPPRHWAAGCCACAMPMCWPHARTSIHLSRSIARRLREKDRQARADEADVVRPAIWRLGGGNAIDREGSRSICRLDRSRFSRPAIAAAHSPATLRAAFGDPASPHRVF